MFARTASQEGECRALRVTPLVGYLLKPLIATVWPRFYTGVLAISEHPWPYRQVLSLTCVDLKCTYSALPVRWWSSSTCGSPKAWKLDSDTYLAEVVITVAGSASFWYIASASTVYLAVHVNGCLQFFAACLDTTAACFDADAVIEEGGSWVVRAGLNGKSVDEQYMGAMVHALLQMLLVGPGLVTPARSDEYLLYFVSLLVGCFSLIYLIASLTARHVSALSGSQVRPPLCSFVAGIASIASATLSTHLRAPGRVQAPR